MLGRPAINLYTRAVPRLAGFYEELGFEETFRTPPDGEPAHVEVALDGFVIGIAAVEAAAADHGLSPELGGRPVEIVLWSDDVDREHDRLTARGAPSLSEPHDFLSNLRVAWVADPDGNPIQLVQTRAPAPAAAGEGTPAGEVEQVLARYAAAVGAKDVDGLVGLYADDARIFDLWGRWSYDGAEAWRAAVADWFGSLGDERVAVELEEVETTAGGGLAVARAFVVFRGLSADGAELRAMCNRLTWALRRSPDGRWRIVHEHSSAPVDVESGTVQLRRPGSGAAR